jgi:hypothetical protein
VTPLELDGEAVRFRGDEHGGDPPAHAPLGAPLHVAAYDVAPGQVGRVRRQYWRRHAQPRAGLQLAGRPDGLLGVGPRRPGRQQDQQEEREAERGVERSQPPRGAIGEGGQGALQAQGSDPVEGEEIRNAISRFTDDAIAGA